jgi:hypothetical protein
MELQGWKGIAEYLNVSPRTAQNWADLWGMPIHRIPGRKGSVFAMTPELEAWKLTGPVRRPPARRRRLITVRLPEAHVKSLRLLIPTRFASMQDLVCCAVTQLLKKQQLRGKRILEIR